MNIFGNVKDNSLFKYIIKCGRDFLLFVIMKKFYSVFILLIYRRNCFRILCLLGIVFGLIFVILIMFFIFECFFVSFYLFIFR